MRLALLTLTCVLVTALGAPAAARPLASAGPLVPFEKLTLANGLQVILHVDRKLPIVHVNEWFHVGSKNERPGRTGFAHLFEHMMFQGSRNADGEYFAHVEKIGASLRDGGVNGTTDEDRTNYFVTAPAGALEYLLWLESDRLTGLLDVLTQEKLDNQREVVKNERRQSLENVPYGRAFELLHRELFGPGHPYSWSVIGSMEDLGAASLEDVKDFFRTYYVPNNLTLVIAGDFDPAEAKRLVTWYFGPIPPGPPLARPTRAPALGAGCVMDIADRVGQARSYLAWPAPGFYDADEAALDVSASLLTDGLSARLTRRLVYDEQACMAVSAFVESMEVAAAFVIIATARTGKSLAEIEAAIGEELARLARDGPTAEEVRRAADKLETSFLSGLQRIGGFGGKADQLARYNVFRGNPGLFEEDLARRRAVTPSQVRRVVGHWLGAPPRVTLRFRPETSTQPDGKGPDRSTKPAVHQDRPFRVPAVHEAALPNGLTVLTVQNRELPLVSVRVVARAGTVAEPTTRAGLASLMTRTMGKGTRRLPALQLEQAFAGLGTRLAAGCGTEQSFAGLEVLRRNLDPALGLLSEVVTQPAFPAEELERERKKAQEELVQLQKDPWAIAGRVLPMLLFGAQHPYGHPAAGDAASVTSIAVQDLRDFHGRNFQASNCALVFVGDLSASEASQLARKHFGAWTAAPAPSPRGGGQGWGELGQPAEGGPPRPPSEVARPLPGKLFFIDRPDSAQSLLALAMPGVPRSSADYYALQLVDTKWSGCFTSRLQLELREKKGYTYRVGSVATSLRHAGVWYTRTGVQTGVTLPAARDLLRELNDFVRARPLTAGELEDGRATRVRGYAQGFETLVRVTERVAENWVLGQPVSELAAEPERLAKLGLDEARRVAGRLADPVTAKFLVVGDQAKLGDDLSKLGLGEPVRLDPLGNPVEP